MAKDKKRKDSNRIPIRFLDSDDVPYPSEEDTGPMGYGDEKPDLEVVDMDEDENQETARGKDAEGEDIEVQTVSSDGQAKVTRELGGPLVAELVATRAELKRVEAENSELKDRIARRQADFENQRKRNERERAETFNRVVADITAKLLPVLDNL